MLKPDTITEINIIAKAKEPTILYSGCASAGVISIIIFSPIIIRTKVTMIALTIKSKNSLKYIVTAPSPKTLSTTTILNHTTYQLIGNEHSKRYLQDLLNVNFKNDPGIIPGSIVLI